MPALQHSPDAEVGIVPLEPSPPQLRQNDRHYDAEHDAETFHTALETISDHLVSNHS